MRTFCLFAAIALLCAACGTRGQLSLPPGPPTPPLFDRINPPAPKTTTPADHSNNVTAPTAP